MASYIDAQNYAFIDVPNNAQDGVLKSWDIRFFGHEEK
ncbi:hypothetical protein JCM19237_6754 [Photobacterium aphoticum]|uniref:Uncharacterized protein n=1 Tax=Photobacterium aphoticum TaxID=754436 RepID=A0A090RKK1_9GAMM|nr:hypothetical protein JCM19237_6754 [Photobacterium aphoticum]